MVEINNVKVYDLEESINACRNSMRIVPDLDDFEGDIKRAKRLCNNPVNSGEINFLKGIRVSFDIKYPNYFSPELQRYGFLDIVSSSSKMHKLANMDMDMCFNEYVLPERKAHMKCLLNKYNKEKSYENFMYLLSNCPLGVELFMRCSTNYEQLATIYRQRKHHKLKEDWGAFCTFIENLPYSKDLILAGLDKEK